MVSTIRQSLAPYAEELQRKINTEDVERLLEIKIRRISRYDINRQEKELREIEKAIAQIKTHLTDMVGFTIGYIEDLLAKYGPIFPRRSELRAFDEVDARAAALSNLTVGYHRETGFIGHKIKAEEAGGEHELCCSEYDRLLLIFKDGLYKVIHCAGQTLCRPGPVLDGRGEKRSGLQPDLPPRSGKPGLCQTFRHPEIYSQPGIPAV